MLVRQKKVIARMNQELASHEQIKGVLMIKEHGVLKMVC